jgi:hypothetical protein
MEEMLHYIEYEKSVDKNWTSEKPGSQEYVGE